MVRLVLCDPADERQQVSKVRVRLSVRETHLVIVVQQRVRETQREVEVLRQSRVRLEAFGRHLRPLLQNAVDAVRDVGAVSVPAHSGLAQVRLRPHARFHAVVVETVWLHQVENVELDLGAYKVTLRTYLL